MSTKAEVLMDLKNTPLGLGPGEGNLQVPFNSSQPLARVYVVNHSATKRRKFVKIGVSERRGISEALMADAQLRKIHNVETIRSNVREGVDMNVYDYKVAPVLFRIMFDGRSYLIPPAEEGQEPVPQLVPEGAWDRYLGNYERMRSENPTVVSEEQQRLSIGWMKAMNPVFRVTIDGESQDRENEFGFIEFVRVVEKQAPQQVDKAFLSAVELLEV